MGESSIPPARHGLVLVEGLGKTSTGSTERPRRADDQRHANILCDGLRLFPRPGHATSRHIETDPDHRFFEELAILRLSDRVDVGTDELDVVAIQHAGRGEIQRNVEPRLTANCRQ